MFIIVEANNYFRIEVYELVLTQLLVSEPVSNLATTKEKLFKKHRISFDLNLIRNAVIEEMDPENEPMIGKLKALKLIDFNPACIRVPGGQCIALYHSYNEFVDKLDYFINKDMEVYNFKNFSFVTLEYGYRDK